MASKCLWIPEIWLGTWRINHVYKIRIYKCDEYLETIRVCPTIDHGGISNQMAHLDWINILAWAFGLGMAGIIFSISAIFWFVVFLMLQE